MADFSDTPDPVTPEDRGLKPTQDDSAQTPENMGNHELVVRGTTVIDRGRRGAKHKVIVLGRTVIDRRLDD